MRKSFIISICLLIIATIFSGCANSLYQRDLEATQAMKVEQTSPTTEGTAVPNAESEQKSETPVFTKQEVNQSATESKAKWQEQEKNLTTLAVSEDGDGVKRFSDGELLRKIEIGQDVYGITDLPYVREYYFDNDGLYFAHLTNGGREMRFYFKADTLIRWIDEQNNAYDSVNDHPDFTEYGEVLYAEARNLQATFDDENIVD